MYECFGGRVGMASILFDWGESRIVGALDTLN